MGDLNLADADFSGYVTKADVRCSDGRTIAPSAFQHMDGQKVPLVYQHIHNEIGNVLGHAILEARPDGMYGYAFLNDTEGGKTAKVLVKHKDIDMFSIWANALVEKSKQVLHGMIREVSLVLSGANAEAKIDFVRIAHADGSSETASDEAIIFSGVKVEYPEDSVSHAAAGTTVEEKFQNIYDALDDADKEVIEAVVGAAVQAAYSVEHSEGGDTTANTNVIVEHSADGTNPEGDLMHQEGNEDMTRNVFEQNGVATGGTDLTGRTRPTLTHDQLTTIVEDAKKPGMTLKSSFLAHAVEYGIEDIDVLFPDAKNLQNAPEIIARRQEWVTKVIDRAKKSPFSRIKTMSTDLTHDEARAKGYVKGNLKKDEWFKLLKRVTTPTTVYKKQKLDRDDIIDITDLDVVAWLKAEMRMMLFEEIARAVLLGDGREFDDEDKIDEDHIRPIAHEDDFYSHKVALPAEVGPTAAVDAIVRARKFYKGSGSPTLFIFEDFLNDMLLSKDRMGRDQFPDVDALKRKLRVDDIVTVELFEGHQVNGGDLLAILVNMNDYTLGATRGGEVSFFDDFDIDYNQYKYLYETRMCGALTRFKAALVFHRASGGTLVASVPTPGFDVETGVVTVPDTTGVVYKNAESGVTLSSGAQSALAPGATLFVEAVPATGYYFTHGTDNDWEFTRPAE